MRFHRVVLLLGALLLSSICYGQTNNLACIVAGRVATCPPNATGVVGVFQGGSQTASLVTSGDATVNLSSASVTTLGDYACTNSTAGTVIDNGINPCPSGQQAGTIAKSNFTAVSSVLVSLSTSAISGSTGTLVCISGSILIGCPANGTNVAGVFKSGGSIAVVNIGGYANVNLVNASTTVLGDYACTNILPGTAIDAGLTQCPLLQQVGFIGATNTFPVSTVPVYLTTFPSTVGPQGPTGPQGPAGGSSGQCNGTTIVCADTLSGANWGAKVGTAITNICSTYAGGTIDTRGLTGAQVITSPLPTHSGCAITYLLGDMVLTESAGVGIGLESQDRLLGAGRADYPYTSGGTIITGNGTTPMVFQNRTTIGLGNAIISDMAIYNFINAPNNSPPNNVPQPMDMAIYLPNAGSALIKNVNTWASYGLYYGSQTYLPFRRDLTFVTGCNCYSTFEDSQFNGWVAGAVLPRNANDNSFKHVRFDGQLGGTSVWIDEGVFNNSFNHPSIESASVGFDIYGYNTELNSATYLEAIGGSPYTWTSGEAYLAGMNIMDSNGNQQKCTTPGTSGVSHPTWGTTPGSMVCENGFTAPCWQMTALPTAIDEPGTINTTVEGSTSQPGAFGITEELNARSIPLVSQPQVLNAGNANIGQLMSYGQQSLAGGLFVGKLTFGAGALPLAPSMIAPAALTCSTVTAGTPTICYHLANAADAHTTTVYYYTDLNVYNRVASPGDTGLSSQATLANTPNTLGTVRTFTIYQGGYGPSYPYSPSDVLTLTCSGQLTAPTITVDTVSGGLVTAAHLNSAGTGVQAQICGSTSTGSGQGFFASVDSNYITITPPLINVPGLGDILWQYPNDANGIGMNVIGRTNVNNARIDFFSIASPGRTSTFCPNIFGSFCDVGWPTDSFTPASRNNMGDATVAGNLSENGGLISAGLISLSTGSGSHSFGTAYGSAPVCTANDTTDGTQTFTLTVTTGSISVAGGHNSDVIAWHCQPASN